MSVVRNIKLIKTHTPSALGTHVFGISFGFRHSNHTRLRHAIHALFHTHSYARRTCTRKCRVTSLLISTPADREAGALLPMPKAEDDVRFDCRRAASISLDASQGLCERYARHDALSRSCRRI